MKAVIYARYSSDSQREESIEGQLRECTEYAERNGITVLRSYIDRALSARTADRPEFQNMIKDSEQKLFDVVLIWKLDRFSRDRYDSAHYKRILKKNGVKVVSVKENISDGPEGIILESMLEGYAEYYSAELSEKIHRGQKENALKGRNNGGGIPLGYLLGDEQKLVLDPVTAPIVREIFQRYADGEIVRTIVEDFNRRGLKTKNGKPFSPNSFNHILKNRKYIGEYRYQDVVIEGGVPAILSDDLFYRVQARLEKNKRAPATAKADVDYLLTTKLFCGLCERMMIGESGTSHTGDKHYYYKCAGAKRKKDCKKKSAKKDFIERAAVVLTVNRVLKDEEIDRIADGILTLQASEDTTIPALKKQLADTERGIENMLNAIQQGVLTSSTKERLEALEKQRDDLKIAVLQAELQKPKYTKAQIVRWIGQFKYGDVNSREYQKRIIDTFVNSMYLFDDRLVITYNFKGGTEIITLKDVEAAYGSDLKAMSPPCKNAIPFGMAFLHGCAEGREKPSGSTDWISRRVNAAILRFAQNQKENPVGTEAAKPPEYSPRLHPATESLPSQGPIPPIRGKCPEGTKGVGMLSAKLTERLLQICYKTQTANSVCGLERKKRAQRIRDVACGGSFRRGRF